MIGKILFRATVLFAVGLFAVLIIDKLAQGHLHPFGKILTATLANVAAINVFKVRDLRDQIGELKTGALMRDATLSIINENIARRREIGRKETQ